MTHLNITTRRANILNAINNPNTDVYACLGSIKNTHWPSADIWLKDETGMTWKVNAVVTELEAAGLVKRAPQGARFREPRHYTLTDAGRAALDAYNQQNQEA
ncbi:hypothetical protein [Micromonospora sp. NPDC049891]|uniref:hypothetical protein n=1 Tax=Micromonospora sp. NPDC049891 TaxID=3155655 RepID=UPI0033F63356